MTDLVLLVRDMRIAQMRYQETRHVDDMLVARGYEKKVDIAIVQALMGFEIDTKAVNTEVSKMPESSKPAPGKPRRGAMQRLQLENLHGAAKRRD